MVQKTLAELGRLCRDLNLEVKQIGKKEAKVDYVTVLADHFYQIDERKGEYGFEYMRNLKSPSLCERIQNLNPCKQSEVWSSSKYIFEEKLNGVRMFITYHLDQGFDFYSRHLSVQNFLPSSYRQNIWLGKGKPTGEKWSGLIPYSFIIDCELKSLNPHVDTVIGKRGVVTESELQAVTALISMAGDRSLHIQEEEAPLAFFAFDVLEFGEVSVKDFPLHKRKESLTKIVRVLKEIGFPVYESEWLDVQTKTEKELALNAIIAAGGEGVVAKHIDFTYDTNGSRARSGWVKIKRSVDSVFGDTVDGFITGYKTSDKDAWKNLVAALEVSAFLKKPNGEVYEHAIAWVTAMPLKTRIEISELGEDGQPCLKKEYYGRVVSCSGQAVSARNNRLTHATLQEWRVDRSSDTCIIEESDWLAQIV